MSVIYRQAQLQLAKGVNAPRELAQALQRDLRRFGYLRGGLDGQFGSETERAVRGLQWDLLFNDGRGGDGGAPVALREFNRGRVAAVNGVVDEQVAACLEDLLADSRVSQLPRSDAPATDNHRALESIRSLQDSAVPVPFLLAILQQESDGRHFAVPTAADPDDFIVIGLDRNDKTQPDRITSRGYGIGQYTLFHHPARPDEVEAFMLDPVRNVQRAIRELKEKFEGFLLGPTPATLADDRLAEGGQTPLRRCRYEPEDPRYQRDCLRCGAEAPQLSIGPETPLFPASRDHLEPTRYHPETRYSRVPDRSKLGCDWPYAVRRYNGSGMNSYHYQFQVLKRLTHEADT